MVSFKQIHASLQQNGTPAQLDYFFSQVSSKLEHSPSLRTAVSHHLIAVGDNKHAVQFLDRMLKGADKKNLSRLTAAALAAFRDGDFTRCTKFCKRIINNKGDTENAYNLLGIIDRRMNHLPQAVKKFLRGVKQNPNSFKLHHNLAITYAKMDNAEKSAREWAIAKSLKNT